MLIRHRGRSPVVDPTAYVAPNATLAGDVRIGPRARVMYGAVLSAEGSSIEVGECVIVAEHAVLRASAVADPERPVLVGDHTFIGPHATVLGATAEPACYLAASTTVLHGAVLGTGCCVAVGALVHARTVVPAGYFVPPHTTAAGDPLRVYPAGDPEVAGAIAAVRFADAAFGVDTAWDDRTARYRQATEVRSAEFAAHADDAS
jgi:carbonic anhydrase/acetyltransferase-like protein (isoleucine patch superfamily)